MIETISKAKVGLYARLKNKKMRDNIGLFLVEGAKSVSDSIGFFDIEAVIAAPDWIAANRDSLPTDDGKIFQADTRQLEKISSLSSVPEVVAVMHIPDVSKHPESLVDMTGLNLLLDGVQDPGNLGTIIRTAHWFGVRCIFLSDDCADVYNAKTVQSAMGSLGRVLTMRCDLATLLESHPSMPVYGTLLDGDNIYDADLKSPSFIIMGNEGNGISDALRRKVDSPLLIPPGDPLNHAESLNVAIATAVTLSQFRSRQ